MYISGESIEDPEKQEVKKAKGGRCISFFSTLTMLLPAQDIGNSLLKPVYVCGQNNDWAGHKED